MIYGQGDITLVLMSVDEPDREPLIEDLRRDLLLVARWARESPDRLAAHDIRAEGWPEGTDRHTHLSTLCVRTRWGDRLTAAEAWAERGYPTAAPPGSGDPETDRWLRRAGMAPDVPDRSAEFAALMRTTGGRHATNT